MPTKTRQSVAELPDLDPRTFTEGPDVLDPVSREQIKQKIVQHLAVLFRLCEAHNISLSELVRQAADRADPDF